MYFGILTPQRPPLSGLVRIWQRFEELGLDSVWLGDHFNQPPEPPRAYFEGWTLLATLATQTSRIRVGVLVSSNTFRHPSLLAHQAMTVDHASNGRLELGVGAGWYAPEHVRFGISFPAPRERAARFRESVEILDRLLRGERTTYSGMYYQLREARIRPSPLQKPRPPLTIAAHKRQMIRVCAERADRWNSYGTPDEMRERGLLLDEQCALVGRDPHQIRRSLYAWVERMGGMPSPFESVSAFEEVVGTYRAAGIDEFIFEEPARKQLQVLEQVVAHVLPRLRATPS